VIVSELFEAFKIKPKTEELSVEQAIEYLNKHCKDGLKAVSTGGLLLRGMPKSGIKAMAVVDTSKMLRTSKDSDNFYQLAMDTSPILKNFPKRSNSFICTTSITTASDYGLSAHIMLIIPVDGTKVAVANKPDIFSSKVVILLKRLASIIRTFSYIKPTKGKFESLAPFDKVLKSMTRAQMIIDLFKRFAGYSSITSTSTLKSHFGIEDINNISDEIVVKAVDELARKDLSKDLKEAVLELLLAEPAERLQRSIDAIIKANRSNLSLVQFGEKIPSTSECWFSGKAVCMKLSFAKKVLAEIDRQQIVPLSKQAKQILAY
jgi:hypothetical protein